MSRILDRNEGGSALAARSIVLAVCSAVLMTLAVPNEFMNYGFPVLGFIALVPLYIALSNCSTPRSASLVTGVFGSLQHAMTSFWLWFFNDFRFWTLGTTTIAYFVVYAVYGMYLWLCLSRGGRARPILFMLFWVMFEYQKSVGFLGYPWGLLAYSLTDALTFIQIADITGIYGISAYLALCNAALAELCIGSWGPSAELQPREVPVPRKAAASPLPNRYRLGYTALAAASVLISLGYGFLRLSMPIQVKDTFSAVLVQTNTDPWIDEEENALGITVKLAREAVESAPDPTDIVLFSETLLRRPYAEFRSYYMRHPTVDPLIPFIKSSGAWLLTGAPVIVDWANYEGTNSAILIDPQARLADSYAKLHPVPFAEAIPFWDLKFFREFMQKVVGLSSGWIMGSKYTVMKLPHGGGEIAFGAPICFEDAFPDVCRQFYLHGADLLINLTNISWSRTISAEIQHWAAARFRAIESRHTLVRSTNGGVSCVVDAYGRNLVTLPLFEATARFVQVPVYDPGRMTTYIAYGDWFALAMVLLFALSAVILMVKERWPTFVAGTV
jgi:apolipoprotein N-acyltransferase